MGAGCKEDGNCGGFARTLSELGRIRVAALLSARGDFLANGIRCGAPIGNAGLDMDLPSTFIWGLLSDNPLFWIKPQWNAQGLRG